MIVVLGAGAFGRALGGVLSENGHAVSYYDLGVNREQFAEILDKANMIVLAVPSEAAPEILAKLPKEKPLIIATKGFLSDKVFQDFADYMVLSGPGFAKDIASHKRVFLTATDKRIEEIFKTDYLTFDYTDDRKGVLMCGGLKNVYAILAGYLGLEPDGPRRERFLAQVVQEMKKILATNGARAKTVDLFCGRGDLDLTCGLPSRNYEFGLQLRKGLMNKPDKTVEGLTAIGRIRAGEIEIPNGLENLKEIMEVTYGVK